MKRILLGSLVIAGLTGCKAKPPAPVPIPTAVATRRNLDVTAEATGKIEPIQVIDIKSKAGGQIINLTVESGARVSKGDLLVELDRRDVQASLTQADADLTSAQASVANSKRLQTINRQLLAAGVITRNEMELSDLDVQRQEAALIRSQQAKELAQQRFDDATIKAPSDGIILDKLVSIGTVIASASSSASGGTTLLRMADLSTVRARVLISETDIGKVQTGMTASVLVDAYPNRPFEGIVEKMEPQAIVDQNVTMFPVLVSLANEEGALMPGMNGEVQVQVDQKRNVLTIPLDAFRLTNEARTVAPMFGLTQEQVDSVQTNALRNQPPRVVPIADDSSRQVQIGRGTIAEPPVGGAGAQSGQGGRQGAGQGGGQGAGGQGRSGRGQPIEVTDAQCNAVSDAMTKNNSALQNQVDALRRKMMDDQSADRRAIMAEITAAYEKAGLQSQVVSACQRRAQGAASAGGTRAGGGSGFGGNSTRGRGGRGGRGGGGAGAGNLGQRNQGLGVRGQGLAQQGIVFVQVAVDTTVKPPKPVFEPRFVRLGAQNYDFAEVTEGLQEGEVVALMAAAKIEMQRRQAADRQKANTSLIPGMNPGGGRGMGGDFGSPRGGGGGPGGGGGGGRGGRGG